MDALVRVLDADAGNARDGIARCQYWCPSGVRSLRDGIATAGLVSSLRSPVLRSSRSAVPRALPRLSADRAHALVMVGAMPCSRLRLSAPSVRTRQAAKRAGCGRGFGFVLALSSRTHIVLGWCVRSLW
mmetsp:Transcript_92840/g.278495  ORF Transcript_92840/g.278495 Transcript_92840/m.278495 type:complete len:129 (+) Transcript_92840:1142-1528(+)